MSRVGRAPIEIPEGVKVSVEGSLVEVSGPRGELKFSLQFPPVPRRYKWLRRLPGPIAHLYVPWKHRCTAN